MATKLSTQFVELVMDVMLKSFWTKDGLRGFLLRHNLDKRVLAYWRPSETKKAWIRRLVPSIERETWGASVLRAMADDLANQREFPDLLDRSHSAELLANARQAVARLRDHLGVDAPQHQQDKVPADKERLRSEARERQEVVLKAKAGLEDLERKFATLCAKIGTPEGGREFQIWFRELAQFADVVHRGPYRVAARELDGAIIIGGNTYLLELKFTNDKTDATDVDSFARKISKMATGTLGLMVAPSGFTSAAVAEASREGSSIVLLQWEHVNRVLRGNMTLESLVLRVRRHAQETGQALLLDL